MLPSPYLGDSGAVYRFIPAISYIGPRFQIYGPQAQVSLLGKSDLRLAAKFMTNLYARFGDEAQARRSRARTRAAENPALMAIALSVFMGPDSLPPEIFTEEAIEAPFAA